MKVLTAKNDLWTTLTQAFYAIPNFFLVALTATSENRKGFCHQRRLALGQHMTMTEAVYLKSSLKYCGLSELKYMALQPVKTTHKP